MSGVGVSSNDTNVAVLIHPPHLQEAVYSHTKPGQKRVWWCAQINSFHSPAYELVTESIAS